MIPFISIPWWEFLNPQFCGSDTGCDSSDSGTSSGGDDSSGVGGGGWSSSNSYGDVAGWSDGDAEMSGMGDSDSSSTDSPTDSPSYDPAFDDDANMVSDADLGGTFDDDGDFHDSDYGAVSGTPGDLTFSGRDVGTRFGRARQNTLEDPSMAALMTAREKEHAKAVDDLAWAAVDGPMEALGYGVNKYAPQVIGLATGNPFLGLVLEAGRDIGRGYSTQYALNNATHGLLGGVVGGQVGQAVGEGVMGATGNPALAAVGAMGAQNMVSSQIRSQANQAPTMADQGTLADERGSLADHGVLADSRGNAVTDAYGNTIATGDPDQDSGGDSQTQVAYNAPPPQDPYTRGGFGSIRNRQFRARYRR